MHPLLDSIEAHAANSPASIACSDQNLTLEFAAFRALACGLASQIERATASRHIGILMPTSSAAAVAIYACWYAGRIPVPLNFLLAPHELASVTADAGIELILTIEPFAGAVAALGATALILKGNTTLIPGSRPVPRAAEDELGVMIYTSGTSGDPKGVRLTFGNLLHNALASIEHARILRTHVFLSVLPQFHSFGFTAMTVLPLHLGASVHFVPRFSPAAIVSLIAEKRVSVFMAVASMYAALLKLRGAERESFASLELAVSGGEPLPVAVSNAFEERFGVGIIEGYGLTESSPVATLNTPWKRRVGSVGTPLPGIEILAVDAAGRELPPKRDGELIIRGHCVMQGYHNKPAQTAAAVKGGALHTGDIGHVDAEGFVHITGRAKELIIVGGENVYPREIENVLMEHPAVAEAAVIGAPDSVRGETVTAFVILQEGATASGRELREFCRGRLAGYKVPREVHLSADLPRGPTGKILKRALVAPTS